jgi:hypothetical protein
MFRAAMAGLVLNWVQKLSTFLSALHKQQQRSHTLSDLVYRRQRQ